MTAPKLTLDHLESLIAREDYWVPEGTTLTVCVLILESGFSVTGESACAAPENFDADTGRDLARKDAVRRLWPLEGYLLRSKLHELDWYATAPGVDLASDHAEDATQYVMGHRIDPETKAMRAMMDELDLASSAACTDAITRGLGVLKDGQHVKAEVFFQPARRVDKTLHAEQAVTYPYTLHNHPAFAMPTDDELRVAFRDEDEGEPDVTEEEVIERGVAEAMADWESEMHPRIEQELMRAVREGYDLALASIERRDDHVGTFAASALVRIIQG